MNHTGRSGGGSDLDLFPGGETRDEAHVVGMAHGYQRPVAEPYPVDAARNPGFIRLAVLIRLDGAAGRPGRHRPIDEPRAERLTGARRAGNGLGMYRDRSDSRAGITAPRRLPITKPAARCQHHGQSDWREQTSQSQNPTPERVICTACHGPSRFG